MGFQSVSHSGGGGVARDEAKRTSASFIVRVGAGEVDFSKCVSC